MNFLDGLKMVERKNIDAELKRLEEVTDLYGGSPERWPAEERKLLEELCDREPEASRVLDGARALDQLLSQAPSLEPSAALRSRILDAALQDQNSSDGVIDFNSYRPRLEVKPKSWQHWPAAGLLAASLAVGLYLGVTGLSEPAFNGVLEVASFTDVSDEDSEIGSFLSSISLEGGVVQSEDLL